jgi:hypothetical protein
MPIELNILFMIVFLKKNVFVVSHQGNVKSDQASEGKDVFNIKGIVS